MKRLLFVLVALFCMMTIHAEQKKFFNLSSREVTVDSVIPQFIYSIPLDTPSADSVYTVSICYPEFMDMAPSDIAAYNHLSGAALPEMPVVNQQLTVNRKKGMMVFSFCPLVFRNNRYQALTSFMLRIEAHAKSDSRKLAVRMQAPEQEGRYAAHSVLATGRWAKIRVPADGIYQLTDAVVRKAGFSDISKVKIYGYGGHLQNEIFREADLRELDDLKEVPQCIVNGKHLFYGKGPVSWSSKTSTSRTRNPYSDYGCYLITQSDGEPTTVDSASFVGSFYPSFDDYHSLYEVDGFSWFPGGRNLFDPDPVSVGSSKTVILKNEGHATSGTIAVRVSAGVNSTVGVRVNGKTKGTISVSLGQYDEGNASEASYALTSTGTADTVTIIPQSGGPVRLDYVSIARNTVRPVPALSRISTAAEYVYNITNQDLHADSACDMVIIIPASQKLRSQAERLKKFHEEHDQLRVRIVPADELYNEFSSGTPDANAYRRYMKMLYDRAENPEDAPRYLLLFGDGVWDNRMLTPECRNLNENDYLLCYESENSFNKVYCYVDDSWMGLLDDGEGGRPTSEQIDIAVGRFPVTTEREAAVMVDKTIAYAENKTPGDWQNTIMFMGDDGNNDLHMTDENEVADYITKLYPDYLTKKVMWDSYKREMTSTGASYPEATQVIKRQMENGALIMDYAGHGSENQVSHEAVLKLTDFESFTNRHLPLWITASCDIMPFDGVKPTIGETAVLNGDGGAVAFYGTTRTVYAYLNKYMNRAFLRRVLSYDENGKPMTIGEAHRLAQNDLMTSGSGESDQTTNHLQYSLLGDPALALNLPAKTMVVVVDSINDHPVQASDTIRLAAGTMARFKGHIEGKADFRGIISTTVRDTKEKIVCKANDPTESDAEKPFTYMDRTKVLYSGSDSVRNGRFDIKFALAKDINYGNGTGLMNLFAYNDQLEAHGHEDRFIIGGSQLEETDSLGPQVFCYLNSPQFVSGGKVNSTPFFAAVISDKDGINSAGSGIGHDLQLIIDGEMMKTYNLNDNFRYDFGSFTSGTTWYSIPELSEGKHRLQFRAWDILNNSTTRELTFEVVKGLAPTLYEIDCSHNPARSYTTFILNHDRMGSQMDVTLEVFDATGRILWRHQETTVPSSSTYTYDWNLCVDGGGQLGTGVYLYRVKVASEGSSQVSKAKKLIVVGNK